MRKLYSVTPDATSLIQKNYKVIFKPTKDKYLREVTKYKEAIFTHTENFYKYYFI